MISHTENNCIFETDAPVEEDEMWQERQAEEQRKCLAAMKEAEAEIRRIEEILADTQVYTPCTYAEMPYPLKKSIVMHVAAAAGCFVFAVLLLGAGIETFWGAALVVTGLGVWLGLAAWSKYQMGAYEAYHIYTGVVRGVQVVGLFKAVRETILQLVSEEGVELNVLFGGEMNIKAGTVMTFYIPVGAQLEETDCGPAVRSVSAWCKGKAQGSGKTKSAGCVDSILG